MCLVQHTLLIVIVLIYRLIEDKDMAPWVQRVSNFNRLNSSSFKRHELNTLKNECATVQKAFNDVFKSRIQGKKPFNLLLINSHTFATHYIPLISFLGTPQNQSTEPFESKHQDIKKLADMTNNQRLFRDVLFDVCTNKLHTKD